MSNNPTTPNSKAGAATNVNNMNSGKKFSFQINHSKLKEKSKVKPLTREFFGELIKLESDFHNKSYTVETLDELTQYYAKAVEYYDSVKDHIASYFLYKIQDTLATKQSLKMLIAENKRKSHIGDQNQLQSQLLNSQIRNRADSFQNKGKSDDEASDDEMEKRNDALRKKRERYHSIKDNRQSISALKSEKAKFVTYFVKVESNKDAVKQNMNLVLKDYEQNKTKNDEVVHEEIEGQKERLRNRLQQRKLQSFMSQTQNTSSFRPDFGGDEHSLDNILDEINSGPGALRKSPRSPHYTAFSNQLGSKNAIKEVDDEYKEDSKILDTTPKGIKLQIPQQENANNAINGFDLSPIAGRKANHEQDNSANNDDENENENENENHEDIQLNDDVVRKYSVIENQDEQNNDGDLNYQFGGFGGGDDQGEEEEDPDKDSEEGDQEVLEDENMIFQRDEDPLEENEYRDTEDTDNNNTGSVIEHND